MHACATNCTKRLFLLDVHAWSAPQTSAMSESGKGCLQDKTELAHLGMGLGHRTPCHRVKDQADEVIRGDHGVFQCGQELSADQCCRGSYVQVAVVVVVRPTECAWITRTHSRRKLPHMPLTNAELVRMAPNWRRSSGVVTKGFINSRLTPN